VLVLQASGMLLAYLEVVAASAFMNNTRAQYLINLSKLDQALVFPLILFKQTEKD